MQTCWQPMELGRKQVMTRQGEVEHYVYFVVEGVQRAYIEHRDKESTLVFSYENSFSGIIDSFFVQKPSKYCLETLTRSRFLRIHYNDFMRLLEKHRSIESWTRIALMATLAGTLERNIELLSFTAEERFTTLLRRSPQVLNMIPHKYLASYIGVDPATFSKLLASVRL
jgi:CRP-like cAMP-binding protein